MTDASEPLPPAPADILLQMHEQSPLMVALFDAQDVLVHANKAFRQAYAVEPDGQLTWADMMRDNHAHGRGASIQTDDIEAWLAAISSRRGKTPFRAFEADLCDGRWIWMTETTQLHGPMLCVASDITSLRQGDRSLRQAHTQALAAAHTDALTGLSNRRHGLQLLRAALSQSEPWPLCIAVLDLDLFKQINDCLGHGAGDLVICDFARLLQAGSRREDGCARLGGEEFLLVLPAAGLPQAQSIVERLLARVRQSRPLPEHPERGYSCSAGLAQASWGETPEALLKRADTALYQAKAAGRDCMVTAEPSS
ncbi:GGDEF domain-containing protein [Paucibacter sp. TC2R-5]|uniref:sensor domain-containing diguanylate cyclase n=1 Tax=Paucibacter sp. TC2R-5 TaxID=2893555 RepID=UPI0021E395D6|nr:sensor domain-containing diguanylate cyclase [Paucibacter sp. TC2R-5]MCV2358186.1 GGDEF domain-containing protein [Paucibacter sp. TC2R-5]